MRGKLPLAQVLAALLAIGGLGWGVFLGMLFGRTEHPLQAALVFGPGYVVTLGYVLRVFMTPPLRWRLTIWLSSILLQGAWLTWYVVGTVGDGNFGQLTQLNVLVVWWFFATVISIAGLFAEDGNFESSVNDNSNVAAHLDSGRSGRALAVNGNEATTS